MMHHTELFIGLLLLEMCAVQDQFCLDWSYEQCHNLRIDTHDDNRIMQHILEKTGYVKCGRIYVEDGSPRIAYHKTA